MPLVQRLKKILKIDNLIFWSKNTHVPAYSVSIYDVVYYFVKSLNSPYFNLRAAAMSYNLFFSIFPLFMVFFTILPWLPFPDLKLHLLEVIESILPAQGIDLVENIISQSFEKKGVGIISFGILLTFWSATSGVLTMMDSFRRYDLEFKSKRNIVTKRFIALFIFILLLLLVATYSYLMSAADYYLDAFTRYEVFYWIPGFIRAVFSLICICICVSVIYYIAPAQHRWNFFTPGSVIAGLLLVIVNGLLKYFFQNATTYDKIYGSIAAVVIVMLWFYWLSIVLLIGFELNAAIDQAESKKLALEVKDPEGR